MRAMRSVSAAIMVMTFCGLAAGQPPSMGFDGSIWVWSSSAGVELSSFPAGVCFFRAELNLPSNTQVESVPVIATADNLFILYVNGQGVGESGTDNSAWKSPQRFDIAGTSGYSTSTMSALVLSMKPRTSLVSLSGTLNFSRVARRCPTSNCQSLSLIRMPSCDVFMSRPM